MSPDKKINRQNLRRHCWRVGLSVTELAQRIGRSRHSVYAAVRNPRRYPITFRKMEEILK
jgi:transposase